MGSTIALFAAAAALVGGHGAICPPATPPRAVQVACAGRASADQPFAGYVLEVLDARTICVATGPDPSDWIKVRVADAPAGSTREGMLAAVFGRRAVCVILESSDKAPEARCAVNGRSINELVTTPEARAQAVFWR